jgi:hypothetical protein
LALSAGAIFDQDALQFAMVSAEADDIRKPSAAAAKIIVRIYFPPGNVLAARYT